MGAPLSDFLLYFYVGIHALTEVLTEVCIAPAPWFFLRQDLTCLGTNSLCNPSWPWLVTFTLPQPSQCPDYRNKVAFWAGNVVLRWKWKAKVRLGLAKSSPTRLSSHLCCLLCAGLTFWLLPHAGFIHGSKVVVEGLSFTFSNRSITVGHFLKRARLFLLKIVLEISKTLLVSVWTWIVYFVLKPNAGYGFGLRPEFPRQGEWGSPFGPLGPLQGLA